jgi:flagellar M-ring protein FliF
VLRPMVLRLTTLGATALPGGGMGLAALGGAMTTAFSAPAMGGLSIAAAQPPALLEDESMVNIAQIEGQMRASSLRRIGELVEKHPEETLSIVRGWMVQENG